MQVIERKIHGENAGYNDIATWKWSQLLDTFNGYAEPKPTKSLLAKTRGELEAILADPAFGKAEQIQLLEVIMDRQDAPEALIKQGKLVSRPFPSFTFPRTVLTRDNVLQSAELNAA